MEAIRKIMTVKDNRLTIELPEVYNGTQVELIILPADEKPMKAEESSIDYEKLYGSLNSGLSVEEIDKELKAIRSEWERGIS